MQLIIFIGIQAVGKSTFFKERFIDTHIRINQDMLKTKHREHLLIEACLEAKQSFVIDKTNPTIEDRSKYIHLAMHHQFLITGYYFESKVSDSLVRNSKREGKMQIPDKGILGTYNKLQLPSLKEGFNELFYVKIDESNGFIVEDWQNEI